MKKILIAIPLAFLTFIVASKLYYTYQLDKNVEQLTTQLRMLGVELDYQNAEVTFGGDIKVEGIFLQHPTTYLTVSVDKIAITTGSIFAVHEVLNDLQNLFIPTELGLEFEGIRLPISLMSDSAKDPLNLPLISTPGCGTGKAIAENEWADVGYNYIDVNAATLNYQIIGEGQQVNLQIFDDVTGMYRSTINAEVSLGATSRAIPNMMGALANAILLNFSIDYQDLGLTHKVVAYCQENSELDNADLLSLQLHDWQDAWRLQGLEVGPKTLGLYKSYLQNPESIKITADAIGSVSMSDFNMNRPFSILPNFRSEVRMNNQASVPLEIKKMPIAQAQPWRARYIASKTPIEEKHLEINLHREKKVYIDQDNLSSHLNQDLFITTKQGKTINGQLLTLSDEQLQVKINHGGGYIVRPVEYIEIEHIYLLTQSKK